MKPGVYCLVCKNPDIMISAGALRPRHLLPGWHVYVGSALGPGGLVRAHRHIELHRKSDRPPRWHIDYLLLNPRCQLLAVVLVPCERRVECDLAALLNSDPVPGFGSSDCRCTSHLFYFREFPGPAILAACRQLGLTAEITMLE